MAIALWLANPGCASCACRRRKDYTLDDAGLGDGRWDEHRMHTVGRNEEDGGGLAEMGMPTVAVMMIVKMA